MNYLLCKVFLHLLKHSVDFISPPFRVSFDAELWKKMEFQIILHYFYKEWKGQMFT